MAKKPTAKPAQPATAAAHTETTGSDIPIAPEPEATSAEKAAAAPLRQVLHEAVAEIDSQEKADAVIDQLTAAAETTVPQVAASEPTPPTPSAAAQQVVQAAAQAPEGEVAATVLDETARLLAAAEEPERAVVAEVAQEVFNPEQEGAAHVQERQRERLRRAVLKRLKPLDALDANLFVRINHLPHTPLLNQFFYKLTAVFNGGAAWFALMAVILCWDRRRGWRIVRESAVPLALATATVEYPVKSYFRRKRPFITLIQAIVIGQKPGSWSFPSGHSATAFAGAWLLSRYFPRQRPWFYLVASLVAFSRIYLGKHYPGDVLFGSAAGIALAEFFRRLPWPWWRL
jgi:undecaprenyl-diphosphatase